MHFPAHLWVIKTLWEDRDKSCESMEQWDFFQVAGHQGNLCSFAASALSCYIGNLPIIWSFILQDDYFADVRVAKAVEYQYVLNILFNLRDSFSPAEVTF